MDRNGNEYQPFTGRPDAIDAILVPSSPMPSPEMLPTTTIPLPNISLRHHPFPTSPPTRPTATPAAGLSKHREYVVVDSTPDSALRPDARAGASQSKYFAVSQSEPTAEAMMAPPRPFEQYVAGDLAPAVQRRRDWTPPPIDTVTQPGSGSSPPLEQWSSPGSVAAVERHDIFKSLHNSFSCKVADNEQAEGSSNILPRDHTSLTKRKQIEAIELTGKKTSPTKTTAPKKKPRTLTELAVAAYADPSMVDGDSEDGAETTATKEATKRRESAKRQLDIIDESPLTNDAETLIVRPGFPTTKLRKLKPAAAASRADGTTGKAKAPRKKAASRPRAKKTVLLSPESARAESMRQDFLFGTSSQLATDQSPTFLRQLHQAMHESNKAAEDVDEERNTLLDLFVDASEVDLTSKTGLTPAKTKLWDAAWRSQDGGMTFDHVVDLEDVIEFPEDPHQVLAMAQRAAEEAVPGQNTTVQAVRDTVDVMEKGIDKKPKTTISNQTQPLKRVPGARNKILPSTQPVKGKPHPTETAHLEQLTSAQTTQPSFPARTTLAAMPTMTNAKQPAVAKTQLPTPECTPSITSTAPAAVSKKRKEVTRPNFEVMTMAQLSKKVTSYGYKPMRSRPAMIGLLSQCWDAQHLPPSGQAQPSENASTSLSTPVPTSTQPAPKQHSKTQITKLAQSTIPKKTLATQSQALSTKSTTAPMTAFPLASLPAAAREVHTSTATNTRTEATVSTKRKEASGSRIVFEIEDSEDDLDSGRLSSPEVPCSIASFDDDEMVVDSDGCFGSDDDSEAGDISLAAVPTCEESQLFGYITSAVINAPPSMDPAQPSWHEKILMYDTIILETFTAWLNEGDDDKQNDGGSGSERGQLRAVGYKGVDVTAAQVKKWCESKSVCCTWRKNMHGKERKL